MEDQRGTGKKSENRGRLTKHRPRCGIEKQWLGKRYGNQALEIHPWECVCVGVCSLLCFNEWFKGNPKGKPLFWGSLCFEVGLKGIQHFGKTPVLGTP